MNNGTINKWFGGLGNNIQQISNAIYFCKENKINFYLKNHEHIKDFEIKFGTDEDCSNNFFYFNGPKKEFECDETILNQQRREICKNYIFPNLKIEPSVLIDDTLVIHIRGGDIFIKNPHSSYVQNPLSYYENLIANFEKVILVSQDDKNPVIPILLKNKKVCLHKNRDIKADFSTLLSCENLATSGVGTFSIAAALLSNKIKKLYCSSIFQQNHLNPTMLLNTGIQVEVTNITNYIEIGEWKNTPEQRKKMIEHRL